VLIVFAAASGEEFISKIPNLILICSDHIAYNLYIDSYRGVAMVSEKLSEQNKANLQYLKDNQEANVMVNSQFAPQSWARFFGRKFLWLKTRQDGQIDGSLKVQGGRILSISI
jgi:hypothetical protein